MVKVLTCFVCYLRVLAFRKYMSAKLPLTVQHDHTLPYRLDGAVCDITVA